MVEGEGRGEEADIYRWLKGRAGGYANGRCQQQQCCCTLHLGTIFTVSDTILNNDEKHFYWILVPLKDSQTFTDQ